MIHRVVTYRNSESGDVIEMLTTTSLVDIEVSHEYWCNMTIVARAPNGQTAQSMKRIQIEDAVDIEDAFEKLPAVMKLTLERVRAEAAGPRLILPGDAQPNGRPFNR